MSYFDWQHLIKPFTVTPVSEDNLTDRKIDTVFAPVNAVETKVISIAVPKINFTPAYIGAVTPVVPLIVGQYNYTIGYPVTIINTTDIVLDPAKGILNNVAICLRYRVGNTVYRYLLSKTLNATSRSKIPYPFYSNQVIKSNFVIEFWQLNQVAANVGVTADFLFKTGQIYIPTDETDSGPTIMPIQSVDYTTLKTGFPTGVPPIVEPQNAAGPWLSN